MFALRRKAVQSAERLPAAASRGRSRFSTTASRKSGDHGHGAEHTHHAGPKAESLGTQFYVFLAIFPLSIGAYTLSRPSADGTPASFSKLIDTYSQFKEQWVSRNTLHTNMIEQAALDRNLFQSDSGSAHVDLKFPEVFNTGSPYNVVAGQGARNIEEVVAHYQKANEETEAKRVKRTAQKEEK